MNSEYKKNGYHVFKGFLTDVELQKLREVLLQFHESWKRQNAAWYADKAINSAYITGTGHLRESQRKEIFTFLGSFKLMDIVNEILNDRPTFMNTQLFFDPVNKEQKNYWHRDSQYNLSIKEQKEALSGPEAIHFRIPMFDEPGIELIPGTHQRWDSDEELNVRLEKYGRKNHDDLSTGVHIELKAGDLLVFSANMIHRGLYGMDRLSLDILFCDPDPKLLQFASRDCLPGREIFDCLENVDAFERAIELMPKKT